MNELIFLKRPEADIGDLREYSAEASIETFELHGRTHTVEGASVNIAVTTLAEGLHLDIEARVLIKTTCDRTLEDVELSVEFGDSELLSAPNDEELAVSDWEFDPKKYIEESLPTEVPMQVFAPGTERIAPTKDDNEIDSRWKGLDGLFASGF